MSDPLTTPLAVLALPSEAIEQRRPQVSLIHVAYLAAGLTSTAGWVWLLVRCAIWMAATL